MEAFRAGLKSRAVPASQRSEYEAVVLDVHRFLTSEVGDWSERELETFYRAHAAQLSQQQKAVHMVVLGLLTEILQQGRQSGQRLFLIAPMLSHAPSEQAWGRIGSQPLADTLGPSFDASRPGSGGFVAPRAGDLRVDEMVGAMSGTFNLIDLDDPKPVQDARGDVAGLWELDPNASPGAVGTELDGDFDILGSGRMDQPDVHSSQPQPPGDSGWGFGAPLGSGSGADSKSSVDTEIEIGLVDLMDDDEGAASLSGPVHMAGRRAPMKTREEAAPRPAAVSMHGWSSRHKVATQSNTLFIDGRYTVRDPFPVCEDYSYREATLPSGAEEFLAAHRSAPMIIAITLLVAFGSFLVHWALAGLMMVAAVGGGAVFGAFVASAGRRAAKPCHFTTPEQVVVAYIAALRSGLFHRAKALLAVPNDAGVVTVAELRDPDRAPLGPRFNTLAPVAIRQYWSGRIADFDPPGVSLLKRPFTRHFAAEAVEAEVLATSRGNNAALVVALAGARDNYALFGTIKHQDFWYVADGEGVLRSVRVDELGRLAAAHAEGRLDDDTLFAECKRRNLSRADITRARIEGLLDESQATFMARRALELADSR